MTELDAIFEDYIARFLEGNAVARHFNMKLNELGIGLMPLVDHCTIRTMDVEQRVKEFIGLGYQYDSLIGVLKFDSWWAKVYRKPGYPALFVDQAYSDERGQESLIPKWVRAHGDQCFHHVALLTQDIEKAISAMEKSGFEMAGSIVGEVGSDLRQVFTKPEMREGEAYTVLELIERHNGYAGFLPPQANGLMESSRISEGSS
ncbi:MAG: hypothetical protein G3M70_16275 [Candidatus Nitronauta litoralis]|uniref:VOC domain-containing protein n=1 Tax=Candidatus Nitronauta litoralis TaxID=2705533 RepID=A0A7T0G1D9_9BACT|nr:MAG: hypothetical protein G3M70_16275 [Candidatus Nitronauta litoralis]